MWNSRMEYGQMRVMEQQAHVPYLGVVAGAWSSWNRKWISGTWNVEQSMERPFTEPIGMQN
jgi:hypothetical protein